MMRFRSCFIGILFIATLFCFTSPVLAYTETIYYIHQDHLGSVVAVSDESGNNVSQTKYSPYGNTVVSNQLSVVSERKYTGQIKDTNTTLSYYNARYYDPVLSRFISADGVNDQLNRYSYVGGNPVMRNDPGGNMFDRGGGLSSHKDEDYYQRWKKNNPDKVPENSSLTDSLKISLPEEYSQNKKVPLFSDMNPSTYINGTLSLDIQQQINTPESLSLDYDRSPITAFPKLFGSKEFQDKVMEALKKLEKTSANDLIRDTKIIGIFEMNEDSIEMGGSIARGGLGNIKLSSQFALSASADDLAIYLAHEITHVEQFNKDPIRELLNPLLGKIFSSEFNHNLDTEETAYLYEYLISLEMNHKSKYTEWSKKLYSSRSALEDVYR